MAAEGRLAMASTAVDTATADFHDVILVRGDPISMDGKRFSPDTDATPLVPPSNTLLPIFGIGE
jgi:hypothetical protein